MNIEERRARHKVNKENARNKAREFIAAYLVTHPCIDCGEDNPVVLTFDHVRGEKKLGISEMVGRGWSLETIKAEIRKCDVVCFNCHMRRERRRRTD